MNTDTYGILRALGHCGPNGKGVDLRGGGGGMATNQCYKQMEEN
jgi:hypothetical protein